jgi:toxin ParE1/3/4
MPGKRSEWRLRPLAQADLEEIWLYTAGRWGAEQANAYHDLIADVLDRLAAGRLKARSAEHVRAGYLKYPAGSHTLFFRTAPYGLEVVRILHSRMDVARHL